MSEKDRGDVEQGTIKPNLCINCGLCKVVCPVGAIELQANQNLERQAVINQDKCIHCGLCLTYCPNSKQAMQNEAKRVNAYSTPHTYGLQDSVSYLAWNPCQEERLPSASGGAITKFAAHLLEQGRIDAMVHVERVWAKRSETLYRARISTSAQEIFSHVSSAYQPIDFSDVLPQLESGKTYFITATPCVVRGLKQIFSKHPHYKKIHIITCALICSHNTNRQFLDFLADSHGVGHDETYQINIRNKDGIPDANNFNNHIYGKSRDLFKMNRFESGWTDLWRNYYFAMNCCLYCSDFWGYDADISVKDAWGEWSIDPLGKSIVIVRSQELQTLFASSGLQLEILSDEVMAKHQISTSEYKQGQAYNRNFKSIFAKANRKNAQLKYKLVSSFSKKFFTRLSAQQTKSSMRWVHFLAKCISKI